MRDTRKERARAENKEIYEIIGTYKDGVNIIGFDVIDHKTNSSMMLSREQVIYHAAKQEIKNCIAKDYGDRIVLSGKGCSLDNFPSKIAPLKKPDKAIVSPVANNATEKKRIHSSEEVNRINELVKLFRKQLTIFGIECNHIDLGKIEAGASLLRFVVNRGITELDINAYIIPTNRERAIVVWRLPQVEVSFEVYWDFMINSEHRNNLEFDLQTVSRKLGRILFISNGESEVDLYKCKYQSVTEPIKIVQINAGKSMLSLNDVRIMRTFVNAIQAMCKEDGIEIKESTTYGHIVVSDKRYDLDCYRLPHKISFVMSRRGIETNVVLEFEHKVSNKKVGTVEVLVQTRNNTSKATISNTNLLKNNFRAIVDESKPILAVVNRELDRLETLAIKRANDSYITNRG